MYDADYSERVHAIRSWLDGLDNFIQVGRNGLHRYNNSDHSMLTAMRAVDNLVKGTEHDIWAVNAESAYHEEEEPGRAAALHRGSGDGVDEGAAALVGGCPGAGRRACAPASHHRSSSQAHSSGNRQPSPPSDGRGGQASPLSDGQWSSGCSAREQAALCHGAGQVRVQPGGADALPARVPVPGTAILETVGRRSGQPRRTPVTDGLDGDTFWIVAEHGRGAAYVRNIEANPRVRVRIGRRWRIRQRACAARRRPAGPAEGDRADAAAVHGERSRRWPLMQTDLLTLRVDLDPEA